MKKKSIYNAVKRKELRQFINDYKSTLSCIICGENHPATLDFHHKNPKEKDIKISSIINISWSKEKILAEISKCDVLCSNCHRKLHHEERNI